MEIREAKAADKQQWDAFVHSHPNSSPYHLSAWTAAVQQAYGFGNCNLIAEESGQITGILPLVIMKLPLGRAAYITLPYCDVGGVLAENEAIGCTLIQAGLKKAQKDNANVIEFRGEVGTPSCFGGELPVQSKNDKVRMVMDLPTSSEALWNGFKSKLRSQIRKAEKNSLSFEFANEKMDDFYAVISSNMRDLGSPVHSRKWFNEIVQQYKENAQVGLVYHKKKCVGAAIILRAGRTVSIPWASTLKAYNHLSPNMLLYWEILKYSAEAGVACFDFGRSTRNGGTYRFKAQWGAKPGDLPWYKITLRGKQGTSGIGFLNIRHKMEMIWQRIPLPIANYIGPKIRRCISL